MIAEDYRYTLTCKVNRVTIRDSYLALGGKRTFYTKVSAVGFNDSYPKYIVICTSTVESVKLGYSRSEGALQSGGPDYSRWHATRLRPPKASCLAVAALCLSQGQVRTGALSPAATI